MNFCGMPPNGFDFEPPKPSSYIPYLNWLMSADLNISAAQVRAANAMPQHRGSGPRMEQHASASSDDPFWSTFLKAQKCLWYSILTF